MDDFKRREFIKLSAIGFVGIALQLNTVSSYAQKANGYFGKWNNDTELNWDAFLTRLSKLAKSQHQLPWDQKIYTDQVKQLLLQCNFPAFKNVKKEMEKYEDNTPNWFEAASLHNEIDFQVSLFQFEEGEYIPHHDHPEMTGVINVVSGDILAKNYTIGEHLSTTREVITDGRSSIMRQCTMVEVGNEIITRGDVSMLTSHEGIIHSIMPNKFTQLVDVFTPAYKADTNSIWYKVNEEGFYLDRENVYEAEYRDASLSEIKAIELDKETLDRYAGTYKTGNGVYLIISRKDEKVFLERTRNLDKPGERTTLLAYEENKFWLEGQDVRCVFNVGVRNQVEGLTIHLSNAGIEAKKMK